MNLCSLIGTNLNLEKTWIYLKYCIEARQEAHLTRKAILKLKKKTQFTMTDEVLTREFISN